MVVKTSKSFVYILGYHIETRYASVYGAVYNVSVWNRTYSPLTTTETFCQRKHTKQGDIILIKHAVVYPSLLQFSDCCLWFDTVRKGCEQYFFSCFEL